MKRRLEHSWLTRPPLRPPQRVARASRCPTAHQLAGCPKQLCALCWLPGEAAICRHMAAFEKVIELDSHQSEAYSYLAEQFRGYGGEILQTTLSPEQSERLQKALSGHRAPA